jgi:hypothetical protein
MQLLKFIAFLGSACVLILFGMDQLLVQPALQAKPEPTPGSFAESVAKLPEMKGAVPVSDDAGTDPWSASERRGRSVRKEAQRKAYESLVAPARWFCDNRRRPEVIADISYYLEQRGMQTRNFAGSWGAAGAEYIAKAWTTEDDFQIKAFLRDRYKRGYFSLEDFQAGLRREVAAELLSGTVAGGQACIQ